MRRTGRGFRDSRAPEIQKTRISFERAQRNPRLFKLYVIEWHAVERCNGYKCLGIAIVSGLLVYLFANSEEFMANTPWYLIWCLAAVPAGFALYATLAILFPWVLFGLNHPKSRVKDKK
ncbi:hypothetical protein [Yoonia sp. R2-816]|uniref:hypothetical protein n=1 Tax=Yoonia sp. R2-816 TaxID=3342638 RepID=UPI00372B6D52